MAIAAFVLALASLLTSALMFWRFGGREEIERLRARASRLEAHVLILTARHDIARAQRLVEAGHFADAEELLQDAAARARAAQARLASDPTGTEASQQMSAALAEAIQLVHIKAERARRQMEDLLASSHRLLEELEARDQLH